MSVNKEYQIVNLMRVTLSIIFWLVVLFLIMRFLWDSGSDSVAKFSAFFTSISSLGIAATIWVYFRQSSIKKEDEERELNSNIVIYKNEFHGNTINIIKKIDKIIKHAKNLYGLTFDEDPHELVGKISQLSAESIKIESKAPSINGYSKSINLSLIAKMMPDLFKQIATESYYIDLIINDIVELRFEMIKSNQHSNLNIYGCIQSIYNSNNKLRNAVKTNSFV